MEKKLKILFLCTGNSCRSQMAEGWAKQLKGDSIQAFSAGLEAHGLNPNAVKVMQEEGVDITQQEVAARRRGANDSFRYCGHHLW
jgi:arsenate reductase